MFNCKLAKKSKDSVYKITVDKKNAGHLKAFSGTPFENRVIFVPQCMRNIKGCKAKEEGGYYICSECGCCKIDKISKKSKELKYKALYILKGGRIVEKLIEKLKPEAVLAVACLYEGEEGMKLCEKYNTPVRLDRKSVV
jgi:uncharacterized protein